MSGAAETDSFSAEAPANSKSQNRLSCQARSRRGRAPRQGLSAARKASLESSCASLLLYFANVSYYSQRVRDYLLNLNSHVLLLAEHRLSPTRRETERKYAATRNVHMHFKASESTGKTGDLAFCGGLAFGVRQGLQHRDLSKVVGAQNLDISNPKRVLTLLSSVVRFLS